MHSPQPSRQKLRVVVTRRLPEAVETRMKELFDVVLRDDDVLFPILGSTPPKPDDRPPMPCPSRRGRVW